MVKLSQGGELTMMLKLWLSEVGLLYLILKQVTKMYVFNWTKKIVSSPFSINTCSSLPNSCWGSMDMEIPPEQSLEMANAVKVQTRHKHSHRDTRTHHPCTSFPFPIWSKDVTWLIFYMDPLPLYYNGLLLCTFYIYYNLRLFSVCSSSAIIVVTAPILHKDTFLVYNMITHYGY